MITSGGLGEAEGGGPSLNIVPKEGGNSVRGSFFAAGVTEGMIGSNYTRRAARPRPDHAGRDPQGVGLQPRRRRADQAGSAVVLRHVPRRRQRAHGPGHVRQRQRRRSRPSGPYVADTEPSGGARGVVPHHRAAADRAGDAAQQVRGVLGPAASRARAAPRPASRAARAARRRQRLVYAGSTAAPTPSASATLAPETAAYRDYGNRVYQAKWTSPVTNRLLLEAGYGHVPQPLRRRSRFPASTPRT